MSLGLYLTVIEATILETDTHERRDNLWAAAAAADPSWDRMSGERESRGRLCEHIARF